MILKSDKNNDELLGTIWERDKKQGSSLCIAHVNYVIQTRVLGRKGTETQIRVLESLL
jgi:hypothetical protein